jgi:hypothetical protein
MKKENRNESAGTLHREQNTQPRKVQNDAPGYGNKKLEGPNRPST